LAARRRLGVGRAAARAALTGLTREGIDPSEPVETPEVAVVRVDFSAVLQCVRCDLDIRRQVACRAETLQQPERGLQVSGLGSLTICLVGFF
jgi:hypothetical protein